MFAGPSASTSSFCDCLGEAVPITCVYSLVEGLVLDSAFPEVLAGFWSWSKICENNFLFLQKFHIEMLIMSEEGTWSPELLEAPLQQSASCTEGPSEGPTGYHLSPDKSSQSKTRVAQAGPGEPLVRSGSCIWNFHMEERI